jgi:hypothetical protein
MTHRRSQKRNYPAIPTCFARSSPIRKNIPVSFALKSSAYGLHPVPMKRAFRDRHERWAQDAVDAGVPLTNGTNADGEVVWS